MMTHTLPDTRLHGRWLILARVVWVILTTLCVTLFVVAIPAYIKHVSTLAGVTPLNWTETETRAALDQLPLSLPAYAALWAGSVILPGLLSIAIGIFIFYQKSEDRMPLLVSLLFVIIPAGSEVPNVLLKLLAAHHPAWQVIGSATSTLLTMLLILLFYLFPDGRFAPRWTRWAAVMWIGAGAATTLFPSQFSPSSPMGIGVVLLLSGTLLFAPVYRYVRVSSPLQRWQTQWVVLSLGIGAVLPLAILLIGLIFPSLNEHGPAGLIYDLILYVAWLTFLVFLPLSFAIAIIRSRLFDIDVIIRRTLIYSVLSALLALVYFGGVVILQRIFTGLTGQGQNQLVTVLSTLAIAALFNPIRRRVQDVIDRRFYRKKYDAAKTLAAFAATCRDETDLDKLTASLIAVVQETMQPESVSLWLKPTPGADGKREKGSV